MYVPPSAGPWRSRFALAGASGAGTRAWAHAATRPRTTAGAPPRNRGPDIGGESTPEVPARTGFGVMDGRMPPATGSNDRRAGLLAVVGVLSLGACAVFANDWMQRDWLASKWLYRMPSGLAWLGAFAALSAISFTGLAAAWRTGRWAGTSGRPLRWLPIVALAAWVWLWTIDPPTLRYDAELALAGAAALWSLGVAIAAFLPGRAAGRGWRFVEIALFEVALCAFAGEIVLRVARAATDSPLLATSGTDLDAWLRAHRMRPGTFHLGFPVNSDGFVDREAAEAARSERRVVCLGDSFSVAVVPNHLHYTTVAEREFTGLEVYNLGVVNAGPREYLRLLELHGLSLRPDLVVVALFLGNDVKDARRPAASGISAWTDRNEVLILEATGRLVAVARERLAGTAIAGAGGSFETFGIPTAAPLPPAEIERRLPWLADPLREPAALSTNRFDYVEYTRAEITLPEREDEYAAAFSYLERIREAALPAPLAVLVLPDEFQVEDDVWRAVLAQGLPASAERDLPQQLIGKRLEKRSIPYVDLLPLLRAVPPLEDGRRHVYHLRDTHFNARGNRIAGRALAELIERCGVARRID